MQHFSPDSRVWVYQADQPFTQAVVPEVKANLQRFVQQWASHSRALAATADVLHERFVVLAVDEAQAGASGCSIDSSVAFLKRLGATYQRDLFNRMRFSYEDKQGQVQTVSKDEFAALYEAGEIDDDTIVFDPLVKNISELQKHFRKPLVESWHKRFV